jgi:hypothetical protein
MNIKMWERRSCIRGSGIRKQVKEMVLVFSFGLMGQSMKGCGDKIKRMAEVE